METKIQLKHPAGKKAVSISKDKYELLKGETIKYLKSNPEGTFSDISKAISQDFKERKIKFSGSLNWYLEWVKLDLEARGIIKRIPKTAKLLLSILTLLVGLNSCKEIPLQRADNDFDVSVPFPSFTSNKPVILFDEGHNNFHTTNGLYKPFADLVKNDGYELTTLNDRITEQRLGTANIFIIANAKGTGDLNDTPAFTEEECAIVKNWVGNGGSLLLIADHFPFGSAVENLANKLGVEFQKGIVQDSLYYDKKSNDPSQLEFSKENRLLTEHEITIGVNKVITFTGQSIKCQDSSCISFLSLSDAAYDLTPNTKVVKDGNDTRVEVTYDNPQSAKGRSQGVALKLGKGRIVCLGEAAMLTAQRNRDDNKVGMNYNPDNKKLALNIMHWLSK